MKQNYKIYLCALLLVGAVNTITIGAHAAPKLAVLVVGVGTDAASDAFATGIGYEVTQKGLYELVTAANNTAVKAKLTALRQQYAQNLKVDTVGLAAWGKEKGLDFVQLVVESDCSVTIGTSTMSGREQMMQVVSCGTTKYSGRSTYRTRFVTQGEMLHREIMKDMVSVAGGVFQMGCLSSRDGTCSTGETPLHYVRVNSFYIGKYPVTQALWKKMMGSLPSGNSSENKPVVNVNWNSANSFITKLNEKTGKKYRLPTEAEWEYAARGCNAGSCESYTYSGSNTIGDVAWYNDIISSLSEVGKKKANRRGLYDMSGNIWEWCSDYYSSSYYPSGTTASNPQDNPTGPSSGSERVTRGGSWWATDGASTCRVAHRYSLSPSYSYPSDNYGLRLVLP